jgi:hypothetical protein
VGRLRRPACTGDELTACTSSVRVIASDHYLFAGERPAFQLYLGTQSQTAWRETDNGSTTTYYKLELNLSSIFLYRRDKDRSRCWSKSTPVLPART